MSLAPATIADTPGPGRSAPRARLAARGSRLPTRYDRITTNIALLDWDQLAGQLDEHGYALTPTVLCAQDRAEMIAGEAHDVLQGVRSGLYEELAPIADRWSDALPGMLPTFPSILELFLARCHAAGRTRPGARVLRFGVEEEDPVHDELPDALRLPFEAFSVLSPDGPTDAGGHLVLMEQRAGVGARVIIPAAAAGALLIVATGERPLPHTGATARTLHWISPVLAGSRTILDIMFHDT